MIERQAGITGLSDRADNRAEWPPRPEKRGFALSGCDQQSGGSVLSFYRDDASLAPEGLSMFQELGGAF
jgi:hypothetical protein